MDFILNKLQTSITVTGVANVHFFEFNNDFYTSTDHHPFYELVYVSSGRLSIRADNYTGELNKKEMILHLCNEDHAFRCIDKENPVVIIIGFTLVGNSLDEFSHKPILLSNHQINLLTEIVKEARNVFAPPYNIPTYNMRKKANITYGSEQSLLIAIERFFIDLIRSHDPKPKSSSLPNGSFNVNDVIAYIDSNFKEKITIDELAFIFLTNRSTLCKSFKAATGITIKQYFSNKTLKEAQKMLLSTDYSIQKISEELQFSCENYFSYFFKSQTGMSPLEYKRAYKDKEST